MVNCWRVVVLAGLAVLAGNLEGAAGAGKAKYQVGVAEVDITPDYPVRLNGFANRKTESDGVTQPIHARALAIGDEQRGPAVVLAVDSLGVPDYMTREVADRLAKKAKVDPARLAITSTHTHTAPMLTNCCPTIFGMPVPPDQQERIDRYTRELTDHLERVALDAIADLRPATLEYGIGKVTFAINRRTKGGPVDHDLPLLVVRHPDGKIRAIWLSYACHCVTLSNFKISGDWAGFAAAQIEKNYPGALALTSIGCGADANPSSGVTGDKTDLAAGQGKQVADEVDRMIKQGGLTPITAPVETKLQRIELPFDKHPTRQQWEETAKRQDSAGYHARVNLAKLDRGEKLQTELSYPVQTWTFGKELAMVFLPGEVVVDYSLRLKKEFDRGRLWINAYSNDVPCYIPSERILKEGGYEGGGAMLFYDRPTKLATGIEQKIVDEVHRQLPKDFEAPRGTEGVTPKSPAQSLSSIRTKPGLEVELVASEPLIQSPVAIDWGPDGRLWVCEMYDYPTGADQNWKPGGRVKVLEDSDGDGKFDKATVFLENIPFPTGVTAWGQGILVCAAPDILYARDTDGDGKADKVEKLFSGFATDNYQARVNSLCLGLDNWIYGANGLLGGTITSASGEKLDIRNHDFRFRPIAGPMDTVTGVTQYGRTRDDWGRWFGCDNSNAIFVFPHEQRYLRRNPQAPAPPASIVPKGDFDLARVYPASRTLERFNQPDSANHITSACGLGIYRDTALGDEYAGNGFVCEPVHNLVHRMILRDDDGGIVARRLRAMDEAESEFLASTDNWFRPVQARTGPDGALYVVDMYRFLIEHPRWIPAERLAQLDVRAGSEMGRIYRVKAAGKDVGRLKDLTKLNAPDLAAALDSPSGTERDRVHVLLLSRKDLWNAAAPVLIKLAAEAKLPQVRVQALCALDGTGGVDAPALKTAIADPDARVRANAVRLCEGLLSKPGGDSVGKLIADLATDPSPIVRRQVAFTLGEWNDARGGEALARLATTAIDDDELRVAVLSSARHHCGQILAAVMKTDEGVAGREKWIGPLVATAAASGDDQLLGTALAAVLPSKHQAPTAAQLTSLASLMDVLQRKQVNLSEYLSSHSELSDASPRATAALDAARHLAGDENADQETREAALRVIGRADASLQDVELLCDLIGRGGSEKVRAGALAALRRQQSPDVAARLLAKWQETSPAARSEIVALLIGREAWTEALLDAVHKHRVAASEISLADRQTLAQSSSEKIRKSANELLPTGGGSASRAQVIAGYKSVGSLPGASARGAELFTKNCSACHIVGGIGHDIGPNLAALRTKDADYLVKNILDPNAVVEPRFVNYLVKLKDGRQIVGVIKAETANSLTLASGAAGAASSTETVNRSDVKDIRATSVSMMPEGFEAALPPQQMADLIAFLKSSAPRKEIAGNKPELIKQSGDGSVMLPATKAEIFGEQIVFESEFQNIGYWSGQGDYVAWKVRLDKPGAFDVHIDYACSQGASGSAFALEADGQPITGVVMASGPDWSRYKQIKIGAIKLDAGEHRIVFRPDGPVREALIDLRTVALVSSGAQPKWPAPAQPVAPSDELATTPAAVARVILDPARSDAARQAAVNANPQFAGDLIAEMTRDLEPGTPAEYQRIPWLWRVAIACGKRNDAGQIKRMFDVALPVDEQPLHDWQAVVIGGGIINGISQQNLWPRERITTVLSDDSALTKRWRRALDLASAMADNDRIPRGTRYDALRMLGVEPWEKRGPQLAKYLAKGTDDELQMGAVSGLADVNSSQATDALIAALPALSDSNRNLAFDALLRDASRATALLDAITAKKLNASQLGEARIQKLKNYPEESVRRKAGDVLTR